MTRPELIQQLAIGPRTTLIAAIEQITKAEQKILLIVADDGRLLGVLTDYDIRRAILGRAPLDQPVSDVVNYKPTVASAGVSDRDIVELIRRTRCMQIPILDADGRPVDVRFQSEFMHLHAGADERVAVVMAGGFGTRMRPMTEQVPKPLLEVGGRPILFILLDQIISEGFQRIYLTLFYKSEMMIERVRDIARYRDCVEFVIESEPLGTAGSLSLLPSQPGGPFLVINADVMIEVPLREMLQFHSREENTLTVALKRDKFEVPYGVAEVRGGRIVSLREKPEIVMDINTGVYIASPAALDHVRGGVRLDMPELVNQLLAAGERVGSFPVHEFWLDVGTQAQYDRAKIRFGKSATVDH
jgi:dTDP-glucose pyrophosphorylase